MFKCIQCGECCDPAKSRWGLPKKGILAKACVLFTDKDVKRIAAFLGLSPIEFDKKYGRDKNNFIDVTTSPCPFLTSENKCSIHNVKPDLCRSWPKKFATQAQKDDCRGYDEKKK